jgi:trehalose 6-phosphate synthase/phosphatase
MSEDDQKIRMERMQRYLKKHNVFRWASKFLGETEEVYKADIKTSWLQGQHRTDLLNKFRAAEKRLLLLDFDGTLVKLQPTPEMAIPDPKLQDLLKSLGNNPRNEVWIISGRNKDFLEKWLGHLPLGLVAEHGGYIKRKEWVPVIQGTPDWKDRVITIMSEYTDLNAESFIEVKEFGVAWHYRRVEDKLGFLTSRELLTLLKNHLYNTPVQIVDGNKVIEVKHFMAHKGTTCRNNILCGNHKFVLAFGDDKTDEDLFEQLEGENEYAVKVGKGTTAAPFRVASVDEVLEVLEELVEL